MGSEEQNIVAYLAKNYGGIVATRALWEWAGGMPADVVYEDSAVERWAMLWEKASDDEKPISLDLVREALFDQPGNPLLTAYLNSLPDEQFGDGRRTAALLIPLIESLTPEFEIPSLWPLLQIFPESSAQQVFVALTPLLQEKIDIKARPTLEDRLRFLLDDVKPVKAPSANDLTESIKKFLSHILKEVKKAHTQDFVTASKELILHLENKPDPSSEETALDEPPLGLPGSKFELPATAKLPPGEALAKKLEPTLLKLKKLAETSADPCCVAAIEGVERQIESLASCLNGKPVPVASTFAEGAIQALWATRGQKPKEDENKPC